MECNVEHTVRVRQLLPLFDPQCGRIADLYQHILAQSTLPWELFVRFKVIFEGALEVNLPTIWRGRRSQELRRSVREEKE